MIDKIRLPICGKCGVAMRCIQNSRDVREDASKTKHLFEVPVWSGDEYKCGQCGAQVIVGFGTPHMYPQEKIPPGTLEYRYV